MREEAVRGAELCADAELRSVWDPRSGLGGGRGGDGDERCGFRSAPVGGDGSR